MNNTPAQRPEERRYCDNSNDPVAVEQCGDDEKDD